MSCKSSFDPFWVSQTKYLYAFCVVLEIRQILRGNNDMLLSDSNRRFTKHQPERDLSVYAVHIDIELVYKDREQAEERGREKNLPRHLIGESILLQSANSRQMVVNDFSPPLRALRFLSFAAPI